MRLVIIFFAVFISVHSFGQKERKYIRSGNSKYEKKYYTEAEVSYRQALDKKPTSAEATFNIGDALYKQGKYEEAGKQFQAVTQVTTDKNTLAKAYYNLGNSYFKTNKLKESADAYKSALRNNPSDNDSKFNLSLVQKMLRQQQQQQQQNEDGKTPDPSDYAKKLKQQAEKLVGERQYQKAYDLMVEGEKVDKTVSYFKDFTNRILDVVKINN